ncbi:MAG: caspase family protein, partial [Acidiferrobacterales bacterium]
MVEQVRRFSIVALLVVVLATIMPAKAAPDRVALVIGNGAYQHAPELANPANDANAIATSLEGLGFTVFRDVDLSRAKMERLIRDFAKTLNGSNAGLFFYAGHGLQVNGKN